MPIGDDPFAEPAQPRGLRRGFGSIGVSDEPRMFPSFDSVFDGPIGGNAPPPRAGARQPSNDAASEGPKSNIPQTDEDFLAIGAKPTGMSDEEYFGILCVAFRLRTVNGAERAKIIAANPAGSHQYQQQISLHFEETIGPALSAFFTDKSMPSSIQRAVREFNKLENQKVTTPYFYRDMSEFGNSVAQWIDRINFVRGVGEFVQVMQMLQLAALSVFSWNPTKRVHMVLLGEASTGKSFLEEGLIEFMPDGTVVALSKATANAIAVGGCVKLHVQLYEEFSAAHMGLEKGKETDEKASLFKHMLTNARVLTNSIVCEDKARTTIDYIAYMCICVIGAYNGSAPRLSNPTAQRFLHSHVNSTSGEASIPRKMLAELPPERLVKMKKVAEREKIINFYHILVDYLIFVCVLPDVDMSAANDYMDAISLGMTEHGFELTDAKDQVRLTALIRTLTIRFAVESTILGYKANPMQCAEGPVKFRDYERDVIRGVMPALVATREITVYACTLFRTVWGSQLAATVLQTAAEMTIAGSMDVFDESCFPNLEMREIARQRFAKSARDAAIGMPVAVRKEITRASKSAKETRGDVELSKEAAENLIARRRVVPAAPAAPDSPGDAARPVSDPNQVPATAVPISAPKRSFAFMTTVETIDDMESLVVRASYIELTTPDGLGLAPTAARMAGQTRGARPSPDNMQQTILDLCKTTIAVPELTFDPETSKVYSTGNRVRLPTFRVIANSRRFDPDMKSGHGQRVFVLTAALLDCGGLDEALLNSIQTRLSCPVTLPAKLVTALPQRFTNLRTRTGTHTTSLVLSQHTIRPSNRPWIKLAVQVDNARVVGSINALDDGVNYTPSQSRGSEAVLIGVEPELRAMVLHAQRCGLETASDAASSTLVRNRVLNKRLLEDPEFASKPSANYTLSTEVEAKIRANRRILATVLTDESRAEQVFTSTADGQIGQLLSDKALREIARVNRPAALRLVSHVVRNEKRQRVKEVRPSSGATAKELESVSCIEAGPDEGNMYTRIAYEDAGKVYQADADAAEDAPGTASTSTALPSGEWVDASHVDEDVTEESNSGLNVLATEREINNTLLNPDEVVSSILDWAQAEAAQHDTELQEIDIGSVHAATIPIRSARLEPNADDANAAGSATQSQIPALNQLQRNVNAEEREAERLRQLYESGQEEEVAPVILPRSMRREGHK